MIEKLKREDYEGKIGRCTSCKEWTPILDPCCNAPVSYEGSTYRLDDFEEDEPDEAA